MIHIIARLVVTHVAHHVARHAAHHVVNQVAQHATHHVVRQVAQHATHHAVNVASTAHQTTQNAGTLQKVAQAGTVIGAVNSGAGLYTKMKHTQKEQEKQTIRGQIQTLQQQLTDLEKQ